MPTDDAQTNGTTPWYAKLARHWGFQATLIFVLLALLTRIFIGDMVTIRSSLDTHAAESMKATILIMATQDRVTENQRLIIESIKSVAEVNGNVMLVLTQICVNGARSDADRRACFERRR
jgi:hypothetical protein